MPLGGANHFWGVRTPRTPPPQRIRAWPLTCYNAIYKLTLTSTNCLPAFSRSSLTGSKASTSFAISLVALTTSCDVVSNTSILDDRLVSNDFFFCKSIKAAVYCVFTVTIGNGTSASCSSIASTSHCPASTLWIASC